MSDSSMQADSAPANPPASTPDAPPSAPSFSSVPDAVRMAASRADDAIRAMREAAEAARRNPPQPSQGTTPGTGEQPPAPEAPPLPTPPVDDAAARAARAEQEARTWRGRFEAEQERTRAEMRALQERIAALQAPPPPPVAPPAPAQEGLSPTELEEYGPDLMQAVAKHARWAVAPLIREAVDAAVARVQGDLDGVRQVATSANQHVRASVHDRFLAALDSWSEKSGVAWKALDVDPGFIAWVAEYDPIARRPRKESLDDAVSMRDGPGVAAFFDRYLDQQKAVGSRGGQAPSPVPGAASGSPVAAQDAPAVNLMDLAVPGGARTAAPDMGNKRVWTMDEVRSHYARVSRGEFRGARASEQDRIEREITLAMREGRVRG